MSKELQRNTHEEVDLGQIFYAIGRAIRAIVNFIVRVFKLIFELFIFISLFIRKNLKTLVGAAVLGFIIGLISDHYLKKDHYISSMVIAPNYDISVQLINNIQLYSELAENRDSVSLSNVLGIPVSEAAKIRNVRISPMANENQQLKLFQRFIKDADTVFLKEVTFEDYRNSLTIYDYDRYLITLEAANKEVFIDADKKLLNLQVPEFIQEIQKTEMANLDSEEMAFKMALDKIDSLRKDYRNVMFSETERGDESEGKGTNIYMGSESFRPTNEIQLFDLERQYSEGLDNVYMEKSIKVNYVNIISNFQNIGIKSKVKKKFLYIFWATGIALALLILIEFNKFLNSEENKLKSNA